MKTSLLLPPGAAFLLAMLLLAPSASSGEIKLQSQAGQRSGFLELYTSEGCSSCPPAEAWLSRLRDDPRLWTKIVPVAFHVDYWDNLGWRDPFASSQFTQRQRRYASLWGSDTVYTPGFVLNGKEWRISGGDKELSASNVDSPNAGALSVTASENGKSISIAYRPAKNPNAAREVHLALLGCGLRKAVRAGENSGRTLAHDFVVLGLEHTSLTATGGASELRAKLDLPATPAAAQMPGVRLALSAWVSAASAVEPEQAVGGWLAP